MSESTIEGLICLTLAVFLTWYAYQNRHNQNKSIWALLLLGLTLRVFASMDPFLHDWDERFHALVAKNMMADFFTPVLIKTQLFPFDYRDWTNNHIWLHKPPVTLWGMTISMHLFGVHAFAIRLPSILLSTASIFITYKISLRLFPENSSIALLAAFFQAINGLIIELCSGIVATDHVDTILLFWVELGILYAIYTVQSGARSHKIALLGLITGIAILCKSYVAFIIPFVYVCFSIMSKKEFLKPAIQTFLVILISLLISGLWAFYAYAQYPLEFSWEQSFNTTKHITEALEGNGGPWWYYIDNARINWNEGIYVAFLFFLFQVYSKRNKSDMILLLWIILPFIIFSASATKMVGYVAIASPAIFIVLSVFCTTILGYQTNKTVWKIVAGLILVFAVRYSIERLKPFTPNTLNRQKKERVQRLKTTLPNNDHTVVFNDKLNIETMFYTNMVSRRGMPTREDLIIAKEHFNCIAVINEGNLSESLLQDTTLVIIQP